MNEYDDDNSINLIVYVINHKPLYLYYSMFIINLFKYMLLLSMYYSLIIQLIK